MQSNLPLLGTRRAAANHDSSPSADRASQQRLLDAGNVTEIGADRFVYDEAGRLTWSSVAGGHTEETTYDAADNVLAFKRGPAQATQNVDASTNRMLGRGTATDITYDGAGSMQSIGLYGDGRAVFVLENDPFRRQTAFRINPSTAGGTTKAWSYAFGPGDVRLMIEETGGTRRFTLRDLDNRIVRELTEKGGAWSLEKDFVHGPDGLVATRHKNGTVRYFHADHLGTPRVLTASDGRLWSRHDYHPFGTEIEDGAEILQDGFESGDTRYWLESKDEPRYEFTGHERDPSGITDYMLARTYLYPFYRFSSVDRARDGWNLYTYVGNNPVGYTDPTGEAAIAKTDGLSAEDAKLAQDIVDIYNNSETGQLLEAEAAEIGADKDFVVVFLAGPIPGEPEGSQGSTLKRGGDVRVSLEAIRDNVTPNEEDGGRTAPVIFGNSVVEEGTITIAHERGHNTHGIGHKAEGNLVPSQNEQLMQLEVLKKAGRSVDSVWRRGPNFPQGPRKRHHD